MGNEIVDAYQQIVADCPYCGEAAFLDEDMFNFNDDSIQITTVECENCEKSFTAKHPDY